MRRTVLQMETTEGVRRFRSSVMLVVGVAAVAASLLALMWAKAPAASAQEDPMVDNEPSFAIRCDFSHRNKDDPIVHPGVRRAAHSHDFFGNRSTNYQSTYESLLAATATTCLNPADTASYWIPTTSWNGKVLKPQRAIFYYRGAYHDPKTVQAPPAGLKVVPNTHVRWQCVGDGTVFTNDPPTQCSSGGFRVRVNFPDCSNGDVDTDSTYPTNDHRSHMAYSEPQDGSAYNQCPQTHPTPVAMLVATIKFRIPTTEGQVTLSSGDASTMHADFFNSWNQAVLEDLVATCIRGFDPSQPQPAKCSKI